MFSIYSIQNDKELVVQLSFVCDVSTIQTERRRTVYDCFICFLCFAIEDKKAFFLSGCHDVREVLSIRTEGDGGDQRVCTSFLCIENDKTIRAQLRDVSDVFAVRTEYQGGGSII